MAVALRNSTEEELVAEVYASPNPSLYIRKELYVDGVEYSDLLRDYSAGREGQEEAGQVLEGNIGEPLARRSKGKNVELDFIFEKDGRTARVRRFTGKVLKAKWKAGFTELTAVSGGYWNDKVMLGKPSPKIRPGEVYDDEISPGKAPPQPVDQAPDEVLYEAILINTAYDHAETLIEPIEVPLITRQGDEALNWNDKVGDLISSVSEEVPIFHADNGRNGYTARRDVGPAGLTSVVTELFVGPDIEPEEFEWSPAEEEFYGVLAFRELTEADNAGEVEIVAEVRILDSAAPEGAYYEVPIASDVSDEMAWQMCFDAADMLSGGVFELAFPLSYPQLIIEDGDAIAISQPDIDGKKVIIRRWFAEVRRNSMSGSDSEGDTQDFECKAVIFGEEVVEAARVEPEAPSRVTEPPLYEDPLGLFRISLDLPWVTDMGDHLVLDIDKAAALGVPIRNFDEYVEVDY